MEKTGTWKLIFRQTKHVYLDQKAWHQVNENDPTNNAYSILYKVDDSWRVNGKFHFKLNWPE